MKTFRLPRKTKKRLRGLWLYPADEKGNSLMASPKRNQEDYTAVKEGKLRDISAGSRKRSKQLYAELSVEVDVSNEKLKEYVDDIFRKDLRISAYSTFLKAKTHPKAVRGYYHFVNAYHKHLVDERSWGNTCCFALDTAHELLKVKRVRNNRSKQKRRT
jgi:hypothetical protein